MKFVNDGHAEELYRLQERLIKCEEALKYIVDTPYNLRENMVKKAKEALED